MLISKVGRNEPCPCGSGKKYKKCCLVKDQAASAAGVLATGLGLPREERRAHGGRWPSMPPLSPEEKAARAYWDDFESSGYEGKIERFHAALDAEEPISGDRAFDLLDSIYKDTIAHGEPERFDALVAELRSRVPDAYEDKASYFLRWRIANGAAARRWESLRGPALELAELVEAEPDIFDRTVQKLMFHGQLDLLA